MSDASPNILSPHHTALRCLFVVCLYRGVQLKPENFADVAESDTVGSLLRVMRAVGLRGKVLQRSGWKELIKLTPAYPLLGKLHNGNWIVIVKASDTEANQSVAILNPTSEASGVQFIPRDEFLAQWSGIVVACKKAAVMFPDNGAFGFRWFIPEIMRYKSYFRDVALAALMSAFIAFTTPLMFQIVVDKVITHHSEQTLYAIVVIFGIFILFDGFFSYVRQYLMTYITSKIDTRLASRTFQHLLNLPMHFFETHTAGILTRHMHQTETIRGFLTGRLFQTTLDALGLPIMITVLFLYSVKLTFIVLFFSAIMAGIIGFMVPVFRRKLEDLYSAEGAKQSHIVETIHGMRTVKSLTLEPSRMASWNEKIIASVQGRVRVGRMAAFANVITTALDKIMQITILAVGSHSIFDGSLSMGALIAFNMVSGRVTGPLVQIVGLINEYQETSLAVKMLGTVMGHPQEREPGQTGMIIEITGNLTFDNVTFRYKPDAPPALDKISFEINDGQVIGVVGRSGSGKTTITKLIQGIQSAQDGSIKLNGIDIRHIDLAHLRRSIGVVLQENFLFRGTIRQNIAAVCPDATLAEIMEAANMAGADEFIDRLPMSYDTFIEENGSNFSGGQRQRIAIARSLLMRPRLLIFDEATSALDPESEVIIQENMETIAKGRTLIVVSHRLTSLAGSDAILMLERGKVLDFAPHPVLLERCDSYRRLWQQQTKYLQ